MELLGQDLTSTLAQLLPISAHARPVTSWQL